MLQVQGEKAQTCDKTLEEIRESGGKSHHIWWKEIREDFMEVVAFCVTLSQNQGGEGEESSRVEVCGHLCADRL